MMGRGVPCGKHSTTIKQHHKFKKEGGGASNLHLYVKEIKSNTSTFINKKEKNSIFHFFETPK